MEERRYKIIYADPPWNFRSWSAKGMGRSAEQHYPTMKTDRLMLLDVDGIADRDCVLMMWATFPCLKTAIQLGESWGFTYKTVAFTWIKKNRKNDRLFMGLGYYTRANAEIVLLFTKGRILPRLAKNIQQVVVSQVGRHSEKPAVIRDRIVELFGHVPRVELFARSNGNDCQHEGWDVFGNEVNNSIDLKFKNEGK